MLFQHFKAVYYIYNTPFTVKYDTKGALRNSCVNIS